MAHKQKKYPASHKILSDSGKFKRKKMQLIKKNVIPFI